MEETKNVWPGKPGVIPVTSGKADDPMCTIVLFLIISTLKCV